MPRGGGRVPFAEGAAVVAYVEGRLHAGCASRSIFVIPTQAGCGAQPGERPKSYLALHLVVVPAYPEKGARAGTQ